MLLQIHGVTHPCCHTSMLSQSSQAADLHSFLLIDAQALHDAQDLFVVLSDLGLVSHGGGRGAGLASSSVHQHPVVLLDSGDGVAAGRL